MTHGPQFNETVDALKHAFRQMETEVTKSDTENISNKLDALTSVVTGMHSNAKWAIAIIIGVMVAAYGPYTALTWHLINKLD